MALPRFFVSGVEADAQVLSLSGDSARHARVLRLPAGDSVTVCDGRGTDFSCVVTDVTADELLLSVRHAASSVSEPPVRVSVYLALPKADKLEHVIQKATELGAYEIVAFASSRCVARLDGGSERKKLDRWQKIAASAAEQSGRGRIPAVRFIPDFPQALREAAACDLALFPYEQERALSLRAALRSRPFSTAAIVTGPEGGFSEEEAALARQSNLKICSLGPRILRCETAPLCALSAVLYEAGALDGPGDARSNKL